MEKGNKATHVIVFGDYPRKEVELDVDQWYELLMIFKSGECDCERLHNGNYVFRRYDMEVARFETWY